MFSLVENLKRFLPTLAKPAAVERDDQTIICFESPHQLRSMCISEPEPPGSQELAVEQQQFKVRLANTEHRRKSASLLINKMYSWRGYETDTTIAEEPNRITLVSSVQDAVVGTLTIGLDSPSGLLADLLYHEELEQLRSEGRKICEYNRLAIDDSIRSKRLLASLFHIGYLYPYKIWHHTDGVLEVNPRHAKFYEKKLGFTRLGPERICPRVNAPAVLLRTNFQYMAEQIEKFGGLMEKALGEKSLYPYFFAPADEQGILNRLRAGY